MVAAFCAVLVLCAGSVAFAQKDFPTHPIKLIIPFAAGGTTDAFARKYAERMSRELGQQMYAENMAGASGAIAATALTQSNPDGYTLAFLTSSTLAMLPSMAQDLKFDVDKDFAYIGLVGVMPLIISVNANMPAQTLGKLVMLLKANPEKFSYGTSGVGGPPHLAGLLFQKLAGVDILHVPYKGSAPALYDAIAGINPVFIDTFTTILSQHKAGKMRILAVLGDKRSDLAPEIPTTAEAGIKGLTAGTFQVVTAPIKTPRAVLSALESATKRVMGDKAFQKEVLDLAIDPVADSTPEKTRKYIISERNKWAPFIKASGAQL
jgi:tripartite-type tricarboxylate transporter receptor subunit TctC